MRVAAYRRPFLFVRMGVRDQQRFFCEVRTGARKENGSTSKISQAIAFSSEVVICSREENASKRFMEPRF